MKDEEIEIKNNGFSITRDDVYIQVMAWGRDTFRVIYMPDNLSEENVSYQELKHSGEIGSVKIIRKNKEINFYNGEALVKYDGEKLVFFNRDRKVLSEFSRMLSDVRRTVGVDEYVPIDDRPSSSLNIKPYQFRYIADHNYLTYCRFEGNREEKIYGLGGYQEVSFDKNGSRYELMQRNSQTSIPFYLSSMGYGFMWNNSSVGEVSLGLNEKVWSSQRADCIDYLVTVGDTPSRILRNYMNMVGTPPMINKNLLGLWQSKLRYQTTQEVKEVIEGYEERNIPLSVVIIDYFHWTNDGDYQFDMKYWAGISDVAKKLDNSQVKLMASVWPTVSPESMYYQFYNTNHMMIRNTQGGHIWFEGKGILDFTHPKTQEFISHLLSKNYRQLGIDLFWADQAEPEMNDYYHEAYKIYNGNLAKFGNAFPLSYIQTVQRDRKSDGFPVLARSAWFGAQKYGALVWSGDIDSSFDSLKRQVQIGLSMGICGISWWTSDIGGFHSGDSTTEEFKILLIRWFQFSVMSPILRMHGDRQPHTPSLGQSGGGLRTSGASNEIWSYGGTVERILTKWIRIREKLKNYLISLYEEANQYGNPIMRYLFYEYPEESKVWDIETSYMLGHDLLVVPILEKDIEDVEVYLPKGSAWIDVYSGEVLKGGMEYNVKVSLDRIPIYCRSDSKFKNDFKTIFNQ